MHPLVLDGPLSSCLFASSTKFLQPEGVSSKAPPPSPPAALTVSPSLGACWHRLVSGGQGSIENEAGVTTSTIPAIMRHVAGNKEGGGRAECRLPKQSSWALWSQEMALIPAQHLSSPLSPMLYKWNPCSFLFLLQVSWSGILWWHYHAFLTEFSPCRDISYEALVLWNLSAS